MAKAMPLAEFEGQVMSLEELKAVDIFEDVKPDAIEKYPGTVRKRLFRAGDVICQQGEGGTTAFYIVEGTCRIFIRRPDEMAGKGRGLVARIGRALGQQKLPSTRKHKAEAVVPIDASVDLTYGRLATTLEAGNVFGEMSCLNLAPRSATVVAETDCILLEILRNMYEVLQRSKTFKGRMDAIYRERVLDNHLKNVWLFDGLPQGVIDDLKRVGELLSYEAGKQIFAEGDAADGMYLIRRGQVRVSKKFPGGERNLAYLTRGDCVGEIALLHDTPRSATCTAADHPILGDPGRKRRPAQVELVKIRTEDFKRVIAEYPEVRSRLEILAERRLLEQAEARVLITPTVYSREVEDLGLIQGQNLMLINLEKCTRCDQCAQACMKAHDDGISRLIREGPRLDKYLVPASCRMCLDPVCMIGCPVGSIRKAKDLNIVIEDWCVGCGVCSKQCPYNSIQMHTLEEFGRHVSEEARRVAETGEVVEVTDRAVVCDQCSGLPQGPACVYACPHDAAMRVNAVEFLSGYLTSPGATTLPSFVRAPVEAQPVDEGT